MRKSINKSNHVFIVSLLMIAMLFIGGTAQAAQEGDFTYNDLGGEAEITGYTGPGGNITIPNMLGGSPVTSIGYEAFSQNSSLTGIEMPDGITSIGERAFYNCSNLSNIDIPQGVISIGGEAFLNCEALTDFGIPQSVMSIGSDVFNGCRKLYNITVDANNLYYSSIDGVLYDKSLTTLIDYPAAKTGAAFSIPQTVTSIETSAFMLCNYLNTINIPQGVTGIGERAFAWCGNLNSITVDVGNLNYISIDGVLYDKTVTILVVYPAGISNSSFSILPTVAEIGDFAFAGNYSLTSISIPAEITSIGSYAFGSCQNLASITFNSPNTYIYDDQYSNRGEYTIARKATIIGYDPSTAKDYATKYNRTFQVIADTSAIEDFVTRFYQLCLLREPDAGGLTYWKDQLKTGQQTGADIAVGFILSPEFISRGLSDSAFLDVMYGTFFDRAADVGGKDYWLSQMSSGMSRTLVLANFVGSQEFTGVCAQYGITKGSIDPDVTAFVIRFFKLCLERDPEPAGLLYWTNQLLSGQKTGADISQGFIFSPEFTAKNLNNTDFVNVMYQVFFDRDPDSGGQTYWVGQLNSGTSRLQVLAGFVGSPEFSALCSGIGIPVGVVNY